MTDNESKKQLKAFKIEMLVSSLICWGGALIMILMTNDAFIPVLLFVAGVVLFFLYLKAFFQLKKLNLYERDNNTKGKS